MMGPGLEPRMHMIMYRSIMTWTVQQRNDPSITAYKCLSGSVKASALSIVRFSTGGDDEVRCRTRDLTSSCVDWNTV